MSHPYGHVGADVDLLRYFSGTEYDRLLSDMQRLREKIESTMILDYDLDRAVEQDAHFIAQAAGIHEDLALIRIEIDKQEHDRSRFIGGAVSERVHRLKPLERDTSGHFIDGYNPVITRACAEKLENSPEAHATRRERAFYYGHFDGIMHSVILWVFVKLAAPHFGDYQTYAKLAMVGIGLYYLVQSRFVDC